MNQWPMAVYWPPPSCTHTFTYLFRSSFSNCSYDALLSGTLTESCWRHPASSQSRAKSHCECRACHYTHSLHSNRQSQLVLWQWQLPLYLPQWSLRKHIYCLKNINEGLRKKAKAFSDTAIHSDRFVVDFIIKNLLPPTQSCNTRTILSFSNRNKSP